MIRTKTSLKDRGLELLGMARRQPVSEIDVLSQPRKEMTRDAPVRTQDTRDPLSESIRVRFDGVEQDERSPREIDEIEKLLSEEADMAVGEEEETTAETPPPSSPEVTTPLPAEEWIAPVPVTAIRPLPHPPPELLTPTEHGVSPSPREDAGLPASDHSSDHVTTPEMPLPTPTVPSPETLSAPQHPAPLPDRWSALEQAIEAAYERIRSEQPSIGQEVTDWCHRLLMEARTIITQGRIEELPRAEWCVEQVHTRLDRAQNSVSKIYTPVALTLWGIGWFFVSVYLVFDPLWLLRWIGLSTAPDFFINPTIFLRALVFGGLGGVAAIFYHVFKYVRERNFDDKHTLSYLGKPFMGMILGAMAYLGMFVLMRVLGMKPVGLQVSDAELLTHVFYMAALYLLAMALGFKENRVFNLFNHAVKAMLGGEVRRSRAERI
ncbi:MAG: hypothetical protein DDG58_07535 [Ardenticatenia bacterium]|nr:MAG: hypothetical protein DDG58_07535 [Ardenticatenia bacterium]